MKQFKDLKVGDVITSIDYSLDYEITKIENSKNSTVTDGFLYLYCKNNPWPFSVRDDRYYYNVSRLDCPNLITPKENYKELQPLYRSGIRKGETDFKSKIKSLFEEE